MKKTFLILCCATYTYAPAQKGTHESNISFLFSIQGFSHTNGGNFNTNNISSSLINQSYQEAVKSPLVCISAGIRYHGIYQFLDFGWRSKKDVANSSDFGSDQYKFTYYDYQVGYDFLKKRNYLIKPLLLISFSYVKKEYDSYRASEWGGGNTYFNDIQDKSDLFLIQLPAGIQCQYQGFFANIAYMIPVYGWLNGETSQYERGSSFLGSYPWAISRSASYHVRSTNAEYLKKNSIMSIRIGYNVTLGKKNMVRKPWLNVGDNY